MSLSVFVWVFDLHAWWTVCLAASVRLLPFDLLLFSFFLLSITSHYVFSEATSRH